MISRYISSVLRLAQYEILPDNGGFYGSIPALPGVWAEGASLEECRSELASVLEDWLLFSLARQQPIPVLEGIDLAVHEVA